MKFKLTKNTKDCYWTTLYQIEATMSFRNVNKWDLWWWIEKEENLSQENNARVYGNAQVYGGAQVYGDARVYGKLHLSLWHFFWIRYKKEEIKYVKLDDYYEIICKWDIKLKEKEVKEMTVQEISEKLGYEVKIIK